MATIQAAHDLHQVPIGSRTNATLTRLAQWKRGIAQWWYNSSITSTICCVEPAEFDDVVADERVRIDIRREMVRTVDYVGLANGVAAAMASAQRELGYSLSVQEEVPVVTVVTAISDLGVEKGVDAMGCSANGVQQPRVCVVPRFAAAMTLHLRSRLGRMGPSEANQLLVEREYNRLCRAYGVRDADIAAHYAHVKNAYFGEQVFDRIPLARTRMSRFARWAMDFSPMPIVPPQAC